MEKENKNPFVVNSVDSLVMRICSANNIDRETIKVHILNKDEINAFALQSVHLSEDKKANYGTILSRDSWDKLKEKLTK